jgi:hypothetical protein
VSALGHTHSPFVVSLTHVSTDSHAGAALARSVRSLFAST